MKLVRKVSSFLKSEKASVSKKGLLDAAIATGLVFVLSQEASAGTTSHQNSVAVTPGDNSISTSHSHHVNHANHSSY